MKKERLTRRSIQRRVTLLFKFGLLKPPRMSYDVSRRNHMLPENQQVVSPDQFDELFRKQALIAEFATESEESDYERRDSFLIHLIRAEAAKQFDPESDESPFVGDDWWPDHTRHLEVTPDHCTPEFLAGLRALLADDYRDYRIQLCVYADHSDGNSYIGSMALSADRVLIEQKLRDLLCRDKND
jgi:hypothetical protein